MPASTRGVGRRTRVQRFVGTREHPAFEWEEVGTSSRVSARWLFNPALRRYHKDAAAGVALTEGKWDALIGFGSPAAAALEQYAQLVGTALVDHSYVEVADEDDEDFVVGDALVRE